MKIFYHEEHDEHEGNRRRKVIFRLGLMRCMGALWIVTATLNSFTYLLHHLPLTLVTKHNKKTFFPPSRSPCASWFHALYFHSPFT